MTSWNFVIQAHIRKEDSKGAVTLFECMQHKGIIPNEITFVHVLSACQSLADVACGRWIHAYISECGFEADVHLGTSLIRMYGKHCNLDDAKRMFVQMPKPDVVTWNVMLSVFTHHNMEEEAFRVFCEMLQREVKPNKVTFICMLDACGGDAIFDKGKPVHTFIVESMLDSEMVVMNALLNMYGKSAALEEARNIFQMMPIRNVVSWTIMIAGFALHGKGTEVFQLFFKMQQARINPDRITYVTLIEVCADYDMLMEGMLLHASIISASLESDVSIGNAVISMYGKCGCLNEAIEVFHNMQMQDVVTWTAMIAVYTQQAENSKAIHFFDRMRQEGIKPNKVTYVSLLDACAKHGALAYGMQVHICILLSELIDDIDVRISLVNMYAKCGSLQYSWDMFKNITEQNVVSWTAMITSFSYHGLVEEAVELFNDMQQKGVVPNEITLVGLLDACSKQASLVKGKQVHACIVNSRYEQDVTLGNSLIYMYGTCNDLQHAQMVFSKMTERNVISWTSMITAYTFHGKAKEALLLYEFMQKEAIRPDRATFIGILDACTSCVDLSKGEQVLHEYLECGFELDHVIRTALVNLYGKCGSLNDARRMFERLQKQAMVSWTVMISVCALHGQCQEALKLLQLMQRYEITPDELTYVGILSACSHSGLIDEGQHIFTAMIEEYGICPSTQHYVCMVDLFGRAGCLDEAEVLLKSLPPTGELLMAFLGACRYKGDIERGEHYAKLMFHVDPTNPAPYVMLWNILSAAEKGDAAITFKHSVSPEYPPWQPKA